jgi:hypothetical protein
MGGKSRKSGQISRELIDKIIKGKTNDKGKSGGSKPKKDNAPRLFGTDDNQQ